MCPKVIASSIYAIAVYERFHKNALLLHSGVNLYTPYYTAACITLIVITIVPVSLGNYWEGRNLSCCLPLKLHYLIRVRGLRNTLTFPEQISEAGAKEILDFRC